MQRRDWSATTSPSPRPRTRLRREPMRVLFFGTPGFAVPSLTALVGEGFDVVGVVTRADKPTGRHRSTVTASPVKLAALAEELTVLQPERPSADAFIEPARALKPH